MHVSVSALETYLVRRKVDLQLCREMLAAREFSEIASIAHKIKGNGATFGLPAFSDLGSSLETAAQEEDSLAVSVALERFSILVG